MCTDYLFIYLHIIEPYYNGLDYSIPHKTNKKLYNTRTPIYGKVIAVGYAPFIYCYFHYQVSSPGMRRKNTSNNFIIVEV